MARGRSGQRRLDRGGAEGETRGGGQEMAAEEAPWPGGGELGAAGAGAAHQIWKWEAALWRNAMGKGSAGWWEEDEVGEMAWWRRSQARGATKERRKRRRGERVEEERE